MIRALGTAILLLAVPVAEAQNALGDGRGLERNPQVGSLGRNTAQRDFASELRFRNSIVTGNAPGGLSFRGDVGYRAPGEFFDRLGSDATFAFRRDSIYSGLAGHGVRGTEALQYQFAMTTGNRPPPGLSGALVGRVGSTGAPVDGAPIVQRPANDERGLALWTLRSPSAYVATRGITPSLVAVMTRRDGTSRGVTASALGGLSVSTLPAAPVDFKSDFGAPLERPVTSEPFAPAPAGARTPYEELLARLGRPTGARQDDPAELAWRARLEDLKRQVGPRTIRPAEAAGEQPKPLDQATVEMLRNTGDPVRRLAPDGLDAYARHMEMGQSHLADGRFFDAEERFTLALSMRPDDPMAAVGRVHAQLGASLFLSAGVNLRSLLVAHPELAGMKYGPDVLPDRARSAQVIAQLDTMISRDARSFREAGLLLAYFGYQTGDQSAVTRGFAAIERSPKGLDEQLDRLVTLLRAVWVAPEPAAPPTP